MQPREIKINFTDNPKEEIALISKEFNMSSLTGTMEKIIDAEEELTEEEKVQVAIVISNLQEMFSLELPEIDSTIEKTLRLSSRDINLSRILRERGIVRFYRLLRQKEDGIPVFHSLLNPYDDTPFARQEDFIAWVALEARMPRSTLFMRFSTYDKMLELGFSLQEAFETVITKPYAMRKVLNLLGTWDREKNLTGVDPTVASKVAQKVLPFEEAQKIHTLVEKYEEEPTEAGLQDLATSFKPALAEFITELAEHPNTKEMLDFVQHDILGKPEISYKWRDEALIVMITRKAIDESGMEIVTSTDEIPFVPESPYLLPEEIFTDLITRLPIKNRREAIAKRKKKTERKEGVDKLVF
jgi:hypothetical protein